MARTSPASLKSVGCRVTRPIRSRAFSARDPQPRQRNRRVPQQRLGSFPERDHSGVAPDMEFKNARGSRPEGMIDVADIGTLTNHSRFGPRASGSAWIVDGQQRSLALGSSEESQDSRPGRRLCVRGTRDAPGAVHPGQQGQAPADAPDQRTPARGQRLAAPRSERAAAPSCSATLSIGTLDRRSTN